MGGLFESKQKTTSQQSTQVPLNFSQLMDRTISFANEGLDTPFQAYNAPRIADLSANEQAGISAAGAQAGMYQPLIDMAMTNNADMQARGGIPTAGDLNQFINPYVDYVLGNSLDRLQEQSDTNMTKIGSTAAMSGAFGGTRHGVLEGANLAELLKSARDLSASTYSDAYDKGMGNWFRSQDLRRGTISDALNIAGQGSAYNKSDINALMQTGLVGRTRDQSVLDFAFSEFMREQQDPFTKAGFASSILGSYPTNLFTRNSQSTTTNTPSPFSQIAGIGMAAAGLMTGNPAAAAGLMSGQQSLGMGSPIGGVDITGPGGLSGSQMGNMSFDQIMAQIKNARGGGFAKGGRIKGYKSGGKIRHYDPKSWEVDSKNFSVLDQILSGIDRKKVVPIEGMLEGEELVETPYYRNRGSDSSTDISVEPLGNWFMQNLPLPNEPLFTYSDDVPEQQTDKFVKKTDTRLAVDRLNRLALQGALERPKDVESVDYLLRALTKDAINEKRINDDWIKEWAPKAHEELANITTRTDPLDDFLIPDGDFQRQYTKTLSSGPTGKKKKYAKGGEVKTNFFDGGMAALFGGAFGFGGDKPRAQAPMAPPATMVEAFNGPQYQTQGGYRQGTLFGGSILDAVLGRGAYSPNERQVRTGSTPAPYTPKPQTPYDWSSFYERQGLNRIPTAQSRVNPNYASGARPDLSMFMQMLQERVGGQNGGGGQLPTPPFQTFAKGGHVKRFAEGGKTYLKLKPSTKGVQDLNTLLGFVPADEVYGGGNTLPIADLLDRNRIFRLAVNKHETAADKFDNPNYFANNFKGKRNSHAFGLGQWQPGVWTKKAKEWNKAHPNDKVRLMTQDDVKKNNLPTKEEQDKIWSIWEPELLKNNPQNHALAFAEHQVGEKGLDRLLMGGNNKTVRSILGDEIAGNVSAYDPKKNKDETVGQYFKRLEKYLDEAKQYEVDRLKLKGGVATDVMRSGNPRLASHNVASNRTQYPQDILEALMSRGGVDTQPFQRKGDMVIDALPASPAGASASVRTDDGNYQIEDYLPSNRDGRVSRPTSRQSKPKSFNSPLEVLIGNQNPEAYLDQRIEGIPAEAVLPDFTIGGRNAISQNDIERMLMENGLDPQPFKKRKYQGGGYVKKLAGGGPTVSGMNAWNFLNNPQLNDYSFEKNRDKAFGSIFDLFGKPQEKSAWDMVPETSPDLEKLRKPFGDLNMDVYTPDNQGTSPEDFNSALENGEPSDIVSKPAQEQLQEDSLTTALKAMIMQEIEDRKSRKEPGPPTLFGREINMPLLKMGLGILANSGYPNSAGEAIGKGVLGALNEEEQAQLDKSKRNNDKLKELLNLRYMQGMVESMDPNIKMQLQREKAMQDLKERQLALETEYQLRYGLSEAQRPGRLEDAKALKEFESNLGMQGMFGNIAPPEPEV